MAPESLKETLRKALAMGADDAVVLSDAGLEGSDVWATAYAMSHALRKLEFDLLIVGGLTDDSSTGAVPGALAEHLGLPCITNARKVEIADGGFAVERETDVGYQTVRAPLPALLTTALTFGEPRYASLKGIMGAKKKTIATTVAAGPRARVAGRRRRLEDRAAQLRAAARSRQGRSRRSAPTAPRARRRSSISCERRSWSSREKRHRLRRAPPGADPQGYVRTRDARRGGSPTRSAAKRTQSSSGRAPRSSPNSSQRYPLDAILRQRRSRRRRVSARPGRRLSRRGRDGAPARR